jgi:hypothetical protein
MHRLNPVRVVLTLAVLAPAAAARGTGAPPPNDACINAIALLIPSLTNGQTGSATTDGDVDCGNTAAPGVWYSVIGTGRQIVASHCPAQGGIASYDSWISVYCGSCTDLVCIVNVDDACGLLSRVSWCSIAGARYLIRVHGYSNARGSFRMSVLDAGPCDGAIPCPQNVLGACCWPDGTCFDAPTLTCRQLGGRPSPVGTRCDDPGFDCRKLEFACCFEDGVCLDISPFACAAGCGIPLPALCDRVTCEQPREGDANFDDVVNIFDVTEVLGRWGGCAPDDDHCPPHPCGPDFDRSGVIDVHDLMTVLSHWG